MLFSQITSLFPLHSIIGNLNILSSGGSVFIIGVVLTSFCLTTETLLARTTIDIRNLSRSSVRAGYVFISKPCTFTTFTLRPVPWIAHKYDTV